MITTTLFVALLVLRSVTAVTSGSARPDRLAILDRLIVPVGVAFALVAVMQLVELWLSNA